MLKQRGHSSTHPCLSIRRTQNLRARSSPPPLQPAHPSSLSSPTAHRRGAPPSPVTHAHLQLILPYLDLKMEYYDLGLPHRDATDDKVTEDAAHAILKHHVGIKVPAGLPLPAPLPWALRPPPCSAVARVP